MFEIINEMPAWERLSNAYGSVLFRPRVPRQPDRRGAQWYWPVRRFTNPPWYESRPCRNRRRKHRQRLVRECLVGGFQFALNEGLADDHLGGHVRQFPEKQISLPQACNSEERESRAGVDATTDPACISIA